MILRLQWFLRGRHHNNVLTRHITLGLITRRIILQSTIERAPGWRVVQRLGGGACHKRFPVFDQPPGEMISIWGMHADHVGDHLVPSPERVVFVTSPWTESSYPCPPQSLKHLGVQCDMSVMYGTFDNILTRTTLNISAGSVFHVTNSTIYFQETEERHPDHHSRVATRARTT